MHYAFLVYYNQENHIWFYTGMQIAPITQFSMLIIFSGKTIRFVQKAKATNDRSLYHYVFDTKNEQYRANNLSLVQLVALASHHT